MAPQYVCGLLGPRCVASLRRRWNALFREQGIDAFFDCYTARTHADLELRLAEMFHLDRRGYIVDSSLQKLIIPLLDRMDSTALQKGCVDTLVNEGGILTGYFLSDDDDRRMCLWFSGDQ